MAFRLPIPSSGIVARCPISATVTGIIRTKWQKVDSLFDLADDASVQQRDKARREAMEKRRLFGIRVQGEAHRHDAVSTSSSGSSRDRPRPYGTSSNEPGSGAMSHGPLKRKWSQSAPDRTASRTSQHVTSSSSLPAKQREQQDASNVVYGLTQCIAAIKGNRRVETIFVSEQIFKGGQDPFEIGKMHRRACTRFETKLRRVTSAQFPEVLAYLQLSPAVKHEGIIMKLVEETTEVKRGHGERQLKGSGDNVEYSSRDSQDDRRNTEYGRNNATPERDEKLKELPVIEHDVIVGINACLTTIAAKKRQIHHVYVDSSRRHGRHTAFVDEVRRLHPQLLTTYDRPTFHRMLQSCDGKMSADWLHEGVLLEVGPLQSTDMELRHLSQHPAVRHGCKEHRPTLIVYCANSKNVQNSANIIRNAHYYCADAVVLPAFMRTVPPAVSFLSDGSSEAMDLLVDPTTTSIASAIKRLDGNFRTVATVAYDHPRATNVDQFKHDRRPVILFLGGEQLGLSSRELELCDDVVTVPMGFRSTGLNCSFDEARNVMDSMSVATSASIVLSHMTDTKRYRKDVSRLPDVSETPMPIQTVLKHEFDD